MARPAGLSKTGGRKAGTMNKKTLDLKERIEEILKSDLPHAILSNLNKLAPLERVRIYMELMPYIYPKRKAVEISGEKIMTFTDFIAAAELDTKD